MTPSNPGRGPIAAARFDSASAAVGVLGALAVVLTLNLLISTRPAAAIGQSDRAGDFKLLTQAANNSRELLIVADAAAKKLVYYEYDISRKTLELVEILPLNELPTPPPEDEAPPVRRRP